jgi:hypothetical protein
MASAIAQVEAANSQRGSGDMGPTLGYISPFELSQASVYEPTAYKPIEGSAQLSPFAQELMAQRQSPQFNLYQPQTMDLPTLLMQMQGRLNQPIMRNPMPQYGTQGNPLAYRPDMTQAREALERVKPSVYKTDLANAQARIAELEAQQEAAARTTNSQDLGGSNG